MDVCMRHLILIKQIVLYLCISFLFHVRTPHCYCSLAEEPWPWTTHPPAPRAHLLVLLGGSCVSDRVILRLLRHGQRRPAALLDELWRHDVLRRRSTDRHDVLHRDVLWCDGLHVQRERALSLHRDKRRTLSLMRGASEARDDGKRGGAIKCILGTWRRRDGPGYETVGVIPSKTLSIRSKRFY